MALSLPRIFKLSVKEIGFNIQQQERIPERPKRCPQKSAGQSKAAKAGSVRTPQSKRVTKSKAEAKQV